MERLKEIMLWAGLIVAVVFSALALLIIVIVGQLTKMFAVCFFFAVGSIRPRQDVKDRARRLWTGRNDRSSLS